MDTTASIAGYVTPVCVTATGYIKATGTLAGAIKTNGVLQGKMVAPSVVNAKPYEGSYTVRPEIESQELQTESKLMEHNLTIQAIPYSEVSNVDGTTIIIGGIDIG